MSRLFKVVTLVLLVFFAAGSLFAQEQPKNAWPAFFLSIFFGFGLGQYYLGQNGTPFLLGDFIGAGVLTGGMYLAARSLLPRAFGDSVDSSEFQAGYTLLIAGSVVILVSRIWQIIDVFGTVDRARKPGKVAGVVPVIDVDIQRTSFELGVNLRY